VDETQRRVCLEGGDTIPYDFLILATGSRVSLETIPGLRDATVHFHCPRRATTLRERLETFSGGDIVVGATSPPHKCPLAPIEMALLLDEHLRRDGRRERTRLRFVFPNSVDGFHPNVCSLFCGLLEERGIDMCAPFDVLAIDTSRQEVIDASASRLPYDLLVLTPTIRTAAFLRESAFVDESGFVPVDPETLKLRDRIYALGDNAVLPALKLGSAAAIQGRVVAANVLRELDDRSADCRYDGSSLFLAETGRGQAVLVETRYDEPATARGPGRLLGLRKRLLQRVYFSRLARL